MLICGDRESAWKLYRRGIRSVDIYVQMCPTPGTPQGLRAVCRAEGVCSALAVPRLHAVLEECAILPIHRYPMHRYPMHLRPEDVIQSLQPQEVAPQNLAGGWDLIAVWDPIASEVGSYSVRSRIPATEVGSRRQKWDPIASEVGSYSVRSGIL
jgi:hypothetical protein